MLTVQVCKVRNKQPRSHTSSTSTSLPHTPPFSSRVHVRVLQSRPASFLSRRRAPPSSEQSCVFPAVVELTTRTSSEGSSSVGIKKLFFLNVCSPDLTVDCSHLLKYSNFSAGALEESPAPVFLAASLSAAHLSLLSLTQWLITARFKHGYSPLISPHTPPIPLSPISALIM